MTNELRLEAELIGKTWGKQEVEAWKDNNEGRELPEWTMGMYCGKLPGITDREEQVELADEVELVIDRAAREVWNVARFDALAGARPMTTPNTYRDKLLAARSELQVAIVQCLPTDDQIIIDHMRRSVEILTDIIDAEVAA